MGSSGQNGPSAKPDFRPDPRNKEMTSPPQFPCHPSAKVRSHSFHDISICAPYADDAWGRAMLQSSLRNTPTKRPTALPRERCADQHQSLHGAGDLNAKCRAILALTTVHLRQDLQPCPGEGPPDATALPRLRRRYKLRWAAPGHKDQSSTGNIKPANAERVLHPSPCAFCQPENAVSAP